MLAEVILASNLTELHTTVAGLTCLEAILERVEDPWLSLEAVSSAIKSPAFLQHRRIFKRHIMEDIVGSYSNVFGSKSRPGKYVVLSNLDQYAKPSLGKYRVFDLKLCCLTYSRDQRMTILISIHIYF